jgi:hypothetical protein
VEGEVVDRGRSRTREQGRERRLQKLGHRLWVEAAPKQRELVDSSDAGSAFAAPQRGGEPNECDS